MSIVLKKKNNKFELYLDIQDVHCSFINSLRRIILTEYPTIAFNNIDYINSDIKIKQNTSQFHNEFLLDRICLLPIHFKEKYEYDRQDRLTKKYKFKIEVENKSNRIINVTTEDFQVIDTETGKTLKSTDFFPPHYVHKTFITILKLNPNPNNEGEVIHFEGQPSVGIGKIHSCFSPVSCVTFKNKRDPEKIEKALKEYLKQFDESEHKKAKLDFELSLSDRYFMTDDNDEANSFEMYIESKEVLLPEIILYNSLDILKNKLNSFYVNLTKIIKDNEEVDTVKINESLDTMESFEIEILNESHTLGNIIQNYALLTKGNNMLKFIAYKNPHPLENKILIKIATVDNTLEQVYIVIENTVKNIISIVDSLLKQIGKED